MSVFIAVLILLVHKDNVEWRRAEKLEMNSHQDTTGVPNARVLEKLSKTCRHQKTAQLYIGGYDAWR